MMMNKCIKFCFVALVTTTCSLTVAFGQALPPSDIHYRETSSYIEEQPDADYRHASPEAYEAFRDIKFSVRIHWGVYSMWGIEASWPLLTMPYEKRMEYNELYKTFNPTEFDAQKWMDFFKRIGAQGFAFTAKHTDGFSMYHTKTKVKQRMNYLDLEHVIEPCDLAYSIEETPFKRDIVKELCDAAHKNGIKIDLYYPHPDWYDADFRPYNYHPLSTPDMAEYPKKYYNAHGGNNRQTILTPNPTPEETARLIARHREQLRELLTNYGKIDMICLDQWMGSDIWPDIKETVKMMRNIQPDVMIRARGIGNYGDYYQPEQFVPKAKENTGMPWMSICLLGKFFAYDPVAENYKGAPWVIHNLIDCVAKGGSFMVCLGPDEKGNFHPTAVKQLEEVGKWLKVNGEGIYETREREVWKENDIYFTRTKDHQKVFAFVEKWPGTEILIPSVNPKKGSKIYLLGYKKPLKWSQTNEGVKIIIPDELQSPENRPCEHAWGFRMVSLTDTISAKNKSPLSISLRQRLPSNQEEEGKGGWMITNRIETWEPSETAMIVCDMWDKHWCPDASSRVAEMAPAMNNVLTIARSKGVKIVHAPSDCMDYYANYPGRKEALKYKDEKIASLANGNKLPSEEKAVWPIDDSDYGCENSGAVVYRAWTKQIDALSIKNEDIISDSGEEIGHYFKEKGVKNVILLGVHTNMCIVARSFGLRAMKRMGMNVVVMRDLTDPSYNHERAPFVDHFSGLDLMIEYIETYICPSILSTDFTEKKQFRFKGDTRTQAVVQ